MSFLNQSIQWHLTEVCPNRCRHCYIGQTTNEDRRKAELDFDDILSILDNLEEFERKCDISIDSFALTGGDPFEYPHFEALLRELWLRKKTIRILGIPERVSEENLVMLSRYGVDVYQVSLDGMRDTHDSIRGKDSFDKTIQAIRQINKFGIIVPNIMYTLHRQNSSEMFELIDYLDQEEIEGSFSFDFLVLEGNAKSNCSLLEKREIDEVLEQYRKLKIDMKRKNSRLVLREKVKLFETFYVTDCNEKFEKYSYITGCLCGIASAAILPNGDLLPCRRLPIVIGNLLKDSYAELFLNHPLMRKLRRISSYSMCGECDYAKVCRGCPAIAYSITGDPFGELVYCNKKKTVIPKLSEPAIDCTTEEELSYLAKNVIGLIQKEGIDMNREALQYQIYKNCLIM